MIGSGYWCVGPAPDGRRFCWAKAPSYICPVGLDAEGLRAMELGPPRSGWGVRAAAEAMGVDAGWLAKRVAGASHGRQRVDGKLTERCVCGARMKRLGFATWTERLRTEAERDDVNARLGSIFGTPSTHMQDGPRQYQDTKHEAEAWARRQLKHAKREVD